MQNVPLIPPKADTELFKQFLYEDSEFIVALEQFRTWFYASFSEAEATLINLQTSEDNSLKKQIIERLGECLGSQIIEDTVIKFEVPEHVVEYGFTRQPNLSMATEKMPTILKTNEDIIITISPNTRLSDIEAIWPLVNLKQKEFKSYTTQSQSTANYKLIYAIYKQRLTDKNGKRKSFEKIFRLYQDNKLTGYNGSTNLNSSDSLERYYIRHKPKTDRI